MVLTMIVIGLFKKIEFIYFLFNWDCPRRKTPGLILSSQIVGAQRLIFSWRTYQSSTRHWQDEYQLYYPKYALSFHSSLPLRSPASLSLGFRDRFLNSNYSRLLGFQPFLDFFWFWPKTNRLIKLVLKIFNESLVI